MKQESMRLRVSAEQKARLKAAADARGLSMTDYLLQAGEAFAAMGHDMREQVAATIAARKELRAALANIDAAFAVLDAKKPRKRK